MAKTSIELDIAFEFHISEIFDMFKDTEIEIQMLEENGPAGGWPVFELTGEEEIIRKWLIENYCGDDETELNYLMGLEE